MASTKWIAVGSLVLTCVCAGCGGSARQPNAHGATSRAAVTTVQPTSVAERIQLGAFAGYSEPAPVSSMSISLRVPRVLPGSRAGVAATWIGASARGSAATAPFIQVGIVESRLDAVDRYLAVWSDTDKRFALLPLFAVRAGDRVSAELRLADRRWTVSIADTTSGVARRFSTREEGGATFIEAQLFQEDVTNLETGKPQPYPKVSRVTFSGAQVDGEPLYYRVRYPAWMSENGQLLAPSSLHGDSFTIDIVHPSPPARRYVEIAQNIYGAIDSFRDRLQRWTRSTSGGVIDANAAPLIATLRHDIDLLSHAPWAPSVKVDVGIFTSTAQSLLADTQTTESDGPERIRSTRKAWESQVSELDGDAALVSGDLRVPDTTPAG